MLAKLRCSVATPRWTATRRALPSRFTMGCGASAPARAAPGVPMSTGAAPAGCFIGADFQPLKLTGVVPYNHDSKVFEFGLPEGQSLNLPVCACILLKGKTTEGEDAVRPYTPVSDNTTRGKFQLLIKSYDQGVVSEYVHSLSVGDDVEFKHIPLNLKIHHPFAAQKEGGGAVTSVSMLCGGTGIAPMLQALQRVLADPSDSTVVTLLYGSKSEADILMKSELDALSAAHPKQLKLTHILSAADAAPEGMELGHIDEEKIARLCPPPADDTLVFVCGVPPMYEALVAELAEGTTLAKLGYSTHHVFKF